MGADSALRIFEMIRKEFLQLRRDRRLLRLILIAPLIQLVIFGYAVSTDVRHVATFVVDLDHSQVSRDFLQAFTSSDYFRIVGRSDRPEDLVDALQRGSALVGLTIPPGFAVSGTNGAGARAQILFDGTDSNSATIARTYAQRIVERFNAQSVAGPESVVDLRERAWFNPNLVSRNFNVPAVIGAIILLVCLLLTSLAIVREREIGTLEQLMVSPLTPFELIAGKTIPFGLIGLLDLAGVTGIALVWFDVPFAGSFGVLLLASVFYVVAALGLGLLISTISNTQQEAFLTSFLVYMPVILLSGFMFPVSSMPHAIQWLSFLNPMRHFLEIVRSVFLKGSGLAELWPQFAALLAMGIVLFLLAVSRFRKIVR